MRDDRLLPAIWLLLGLLIVGITRWHPTQATSPDSVHYLRVATDVRPYDGTFPPGYSLLIGLVWKLTSLPVLWASKLVNWLALGLFAWLWASRIGAHRTSPLLALWLLPGNLRLAAYTWSETVFVVVLLELVWYLSRYREERPKAQRPRLAGLVLSLIWVRYVGVFLLLKRATALYALVGIGLLLLCNFVLTNQLFGGPRFIPTEPGPALVRMAGRAVLNEFLLYNKQPTGRQSLFWLALIGQVVGVISIAAWVRGRRVRSLAQALSDPLIRELFWIGLAYFLTLFGLRFLSPFDPLNERLLAPGSICWQMALVLWLQPNRLSPSTAALQTRSPEPNPSIP